MLNALSGDLVIIRSVLNDRPNITIVIEKNDTSVLFLFENATVGTYGLSYIEHSHRMFERVSKR